MKEELETLIQAARIFSEDIGTEFGREKCAMFIMKSGKRQMTEWMELPNQEKSECSEERKLTNTWKYLKWTPQTCGDEMKRKNEYHRRKRKQLETKLYSRNNIKGIDSWAVPFVRY